MRYYIGVILVSLIWFQGCYQVTALRCLKCFSYISMADCMSKGKLSVVKCNDVYNRCSNTTVKIYVEMMKETLTGYELGCAKEAECQQKLCARHFGIDMGVTKYTKCDIACCPRDLCPLLPNATIRTPVQVGPDKGARGGVGTVTLWHVYVWITVAGVFFLLF